VDEFFRGPKKHPEAVCVKVGWADNPWFPEELKKEKDFDYDKDPLAAEHVWGGGYEIIAQGAYYAKLMHQAEMDGRIRDVPWMPGVPVMTFWDLGIGDPTAIWFAQQKDGWVHLIDYVENSGEGAEYYVKQLKEKPYVYGEHVLPHDAGNSDWSTGRTRVQTLAGLGINARVLEREAVVDDGIAAVRSLLPRCIFDAKHCERGIEALRHYRAEYDEKVLTLKNRPLHDWTSHGADAFRYLARGLPDQSFIEKPKDRYSRRRASGGSAWANL
jgi:phage terminase large subunit